MGHLRKTTTLVFAAFGLLVLAAGCAAEADDEPVDEVEDAVAGGVAGRVKGSSSGYAYLRWSPHGPAFAYAHEGQAIRVYAKKDQQGAYYCGKVSGYAYGWIMASEVGGVASSDVPEGRGPCEFDGPGATSVLYWRCHVKAGASAPLRYAPRASAPVVHENGAPRVLAAGAGLGLATDAHCNRPAAKDGFVWVADNAPSNGADCRSPTPGDGGWVPASAIVCASTNATTSGCVASDHCTTKYRRVPYAASSAPAPVPAAPGPAEAGRCCAKCKARSALYHADASHRSCEDAGRAFCSLSGRGGLAYTTIGHCADAP